jgi:RNA polymerase sigma factor (sigma-70 family)
MGTLTQPDVVDLLGPLRRYARSLTRDDTQAEDLVHDALVRALERQHTLRPSSNLRTWLMTVLHNVFIDGQRRRRTEARYADDLARDQDRAAPAAQEHSLRLAQVRRAFDALPDEQRAAIHLVTIDGLPYQEAADVLGIPIGTLMSRLGRARAALRSLEEAEPAPRPEPAPRLRVVGGVDVPDRADANIRTGGRRD